MYVFDKMGIYWAEIADQNHTERQVEFLKKAMNKKGLILDLACGTGRHLVLLSKEGYNVVGLDISPNLLKIAKARWQDSQLIRADMRFLPFKPQAFSAAISMDTSFGYLPSLQDDKESLSELHAALHKDGILVVDVFNRERLTKRYKIGSQSVGKEYPSFFLLQKRTVDADGEKLRDLWTVRDKKDGQIRVFDHKARLYKFNQLEELLENAGFSINEVYGDYERQGFSPDSNRLILIAYSF